MSEKEIKKLADARGMTVDEVKALLNDHTSVPLCGGVKALNEKEG